MRRGEALPRPVRFFSRLVGKIRPELALGLLLGLFALLALDHGVGHHGGDELDGADGVIVAGDGVVDLVGIAVGIDDGDDRDAQNAGLLHGDALLARIDDEQRARQLLHLADAAQILQQLLALSAELVDFLLGQDFELAVLLHLVDPR